MRRPLNWIVVAISFVCLGANLWWADRTPAETRIVTLQRDGALLRAAVEGRAVTLGDFSLDAVAEDERQLFAWLPAVAAGDDGELRVE